MRFVGSREDEDLLDLLVRRICLSMNPTPGEAQKMRTDLAVVHLNGCPLDLDGLLLADAADFIVEVWDIHRYLDRSTGQLTHGHKPRFRKEKG